MSISNRFKFLLFSVFILLFCFNNAQAQKLKGEPVPGAEVYIEQENFNEPMSVTTTDKKGRFEITFSKGYKFSSSGILTLTITPPKKSKKIKKKFPGIVQQKIIIKYTTRKGKIDAFCSAPGDPYPHAYSNYKESKKRGSKKITTLKFILIWNPVKVNANGSRGGFAVGGYNPT